MIADNLKNAAIYKSLSANFRTAFDWLEKTDLAALEKGRHVVDGEQVYVNVNEYETLPFEQCRLEIHKNYADIQVIVRGKEQMAWQPLEQVELLDSYNPEKDIQFAAGKPVLYPVGEGDFSIFFPQDAHLGKVMIDNPAPGKKAVVKVRL